MYYRRKVEEKLKDVLHQFPVILITGARQSGKTTLLKESLPEYQYVSLDDPAVRDFAIKDPKLFLETHNKPVIIDEIQYAPNLLSYIKINVDQDRHNYGQFILTGSQPIQLMEHISETLSGRIAIFNLYPFGWEEIENIPEYEKSIFNSQQLIERILQGFYPEFFINPCLDKNIWLGSYLNTYLERDIRNIKTISDLSKFQTFVGLLAARAGQLLNISEVAKECGISQPTAKSWISLLESTYIIYLLRPYHKNHTKKLVKTPKLYFIDTGLLCYLLGIDCVERFLKASERGHIFENMIIMEMLKRRSYNFEKKQFYFYRTATGLEVDLIIDDGDEISAFEIKFHKTVNVQFGKNLKLFQKDYKTKRSVVLTLQEENFPIANDILSQNWYEGIK